MRDNNSERNFKRSENDAFPEIIALRSQLLLSFAYNKGC